MVIIDVIQNLGQLLAKSSAFTTINAGQQATNQLQLSPGQQVQAEVMANLPNQRFLARIAGELFRIELPIIVQPGELLQLTFVSGEPNPTFTLSRSANSSTPVTISDTGKWLCRLSLDQADQQQVNALLRNTSLLDGPPTDTTLFAGMLADALTLNGLFYESHLFQWFLGERKLKELLKEPQGKLSGRKKPPQDGNSAQNRIKTDEWDPDESPDESIADELISADSHRDPIVQVDPRTIPLIRDQLETLYSGRIAWHGQVWPGQEMEWSVREEKPATCQGTGKSWQTTLRLDLPKLGEVNATLRLENDGLSIQIYTGRDSTSAVMKMERHNLEQAMSEAGIKLLKLIIGNEEHGKGT
jgi:hypothetical protein